MDQKKAIIMMATYNGEKTIRKQLDSILSQTFTNWELYISDDNSSDKTYEILLEYQKKDERIKKILVNEKYHGAFANYFNVMRYVKRNVEPYDYYFYCDQDDVWIDKKIEIEVNTLMNMEKKYGKIPVFCYSDLELVDANGQLLDDRMSNYIRIQFCQNPYNIFFKEQYVWGTTMAHNNELWTVVAIEDADKVKNNIPHDTYISRYAALYAKIEFIEQALVLYTRHGNNVTGIPKGYNIFQAVKKVFQKTPQIINSAADSYRGGVYLLSNIENKDKFMNELNACLQKGGRNAQKFIKKYGIIKEEHFFGKLSTKFILYTGIYKVTKAYRK